MSFEKRFDRKQFLALTLGTSSTLVLGCSADAAPGGGGGAGSGGTGGAAGTFSSGGTAGTFSTGGAGAGTSGAAMGGAGSGGGGTAGMAGAGGAPIAPDCAAQLRVFISANHGHKLEVSAADVMAGVAKIYDTKGISDHDHFIQLTSADFAKLQAGGTVRKLTCNDKHEHEYIVNCVGVEKPETTSGIPGFCETDRECAGAMDKICPELP